MTIEFRLKEERKRLGYNQTRFGEVGDVTKNTQINYEKGVRPPDSSYLEAIAKIGADVQYVLTGVRSINIDTLNYSTNTELKPVNRLEVKEAPEKYEMVGKATTTETLSREQLQWLELLDLLSSDDRNKLKDLAVSLAEAAVAKRGG